MQIIFNNKELNRDYITKLALDNQFISTLLDSYNYSKLTYEQVLIGIIACLINDTDDGILIVEEESRGD